MKTILKPAVYKILKLFYENRNKPLHLREIARKTNMNESSLSRHLNDLTKNNILITEPEANLKKFYISKSKISEIFPFFDSEKIESLPILRRDAIKLYLSHLENKPLLLIVFGSTSKGTFRKDSDLDFLEVTSAKKNTDKTKKYVESQTGIKIQLFQITEKQFKDELVLKKDKVVQSALETGFPVFNEKFFYEVMNHE